MKCMKETTLATTILKSSQNPFVFATFQNGAVVVCKCVFVWVLWLYLCNAIYFSPKDNKCFGRAPDEAKFPHFISAGSARSFSTWLRLCCYPSTNTGKTQEALRTLKKMHFKRGNLCDLWVHLNSFWRRFSKIWLDASKFWLFWWITITCWEKNVLNINFYQVQYT